MTILDLRDIVWRGCAPWREHTSHVHDRRLWLALEAAGYRVEQQQDERHGWYWRVERSGCRTVHRRLYRAAAAYFDFDAQTALLVTRELGRRSDEGAEYVSPHLRMWRNGVSL